MRRFLFLLFASLVLPLAGRAQDFWLNDPQDATRANLWSIAYGNRTLVAIGEQGTIVSNNKDAPGWVAQSSGASVWLVGAGFGAGRFVAVGDFGVILTSDDNGATWTPRDSGTRTRLNAVAFGNGRWLAVGEQGIVLTSSDAISWTARPALGTGFLRALAFGQGQFLVGGAGGVLFTSPDAATFTRVPIETTANIEGAAISPNHFWVVGSAGLRATATQLGQWTFGPARPQTFRGVAVRNGEEASTVGEFVWEAYVFNGTGQQTWTSISQPDFLATAIVRADDELVSVGFGGNIRRSKMDSLPFLLRTPSQQTYGGPVELRLASGLDITSYQWTRNGVAIPGATQASFTLAAVTPADARNLALRFTTRDGRTTTLAAAITVVPGGRPEVRDLAFHSTLPTVPTLVAPQPDGKLLVAGAFTVTPDGGDTFGLARLNADGALDRGFRAGEGLSITSSINALHVLPDGRIYVTGNFSRIAGAPRPGLARLLPNGALDATFAPDASLASPTGVSRAALASDGGVFVQLTPSASPDSTIVRLGPNANSLFALPRHWLVGVDPPGRLLAVRNHPSFDGELVRYSGDGTLDPTFAPTRVQVFSASGSGLIDPVVTNAGVYAKASMGRLLRVYTHWRTSPQGGLDPSYLAPPSQQMFDYSSPFAADGSFWMPVNYSGSGAFEPVLFGPDGAADPGAYATLPNAMRYSVLAFAPDGAIYAVERDATPSAAPELIRIRPIRGAIGRLTNLSVRAFLPTSDTPLIAGFVTRGVGFTRVLARAIGPGLQQFGITDALRDPRLTLTRNGAELMTNDDWSAATASRFAGLGAFPLTSGSKDAVLESPVVDGDFTGIVRPAVNDSGTALVEFYESSEEPAPTRRWVNLSALGRVSPDRPLIAGFAITGAAPLRVLVRASGPALETFGVAGRLANPQLVLYRQTTPLWENDDWASDSTTASVTAAAAQRVGAFSLQGGGKDAAFLVTLAPGSYTAVVTGANGSESTGTALIEIYEVP